MSNPDHYDAAFDRWTEEQLTKPQQALLAEVRAKGTVHKNGRIRKTAEALRNAGLVTIDWWPVPNAMGMPTEYWEITAL